MVTLGPSVGKPSATFELLVAPQQLGKHEAWAALQARLLEARGCIIYNSMPAKVVQLREL